MESNTPLGRPEEQPRISPSGADPEFTLTQEGKLNIRSQQQLKFVKCSPLDGKLELWADKYSGGVGGEMIVEGG
jgi:hypothetical protein